MEKLQWHARCLAAAGGPRLFCCLHSTAFATLLWLRLLCKAKFALLLPLRESHSSSMRSAEKAWHCYLLRVDRGIRLEPITLFALTTADADVTMLPAAQQAQCTKELLVRHGRVLHDGWTREDNLSG